MANLDRSDAQPVGDRVTRGADREQRGGEHDHGGGDRERGPHPSSSSADTRHHAPEHDVGEVLRGRVIEVLGEVEERGFQVDHSVTSSPSATRSMSSARDSRDFAVPRGHDSASAVSISLRPAK